ncbi:histidine phosphatase family protein [Oscillospiraceae bacterium PP1C4]
MEIFLIRHAQTQGNLEHRYIGRTDEPLSDAGIACFCNLAYPAANRVYISPMLRCRQTAEILYPMEKPFVVDDFRECDFGDFENKSYNELKDQPDYQAWIDGKGALPGGETTQAFKLRCCEAFRKVIDQAFADGLSSAAFVVHGGTIMAILERFAQPHRDFYEWQPPNMGGWAVHIDRMTWQDGNVLSVERKIENR